MPFLTHRPASDTPKVHFSHFLFSYRYVDTNTHKDRWNGEISFQAMQMAGRKEGRKNHSTLQERLRIQNDLGRFAKWSGKEYREGV